MTEQDLEQVREALTDAVLNDAIDAWWDARAVNAMRDRLMAALAPLVRPAPTCATCQWWRAPGLTGLCDHPNRPMSQMATNADYRCGLHTPRPSTPEGSAK